ncbi:efflux RND transporter periplasmic adaptor subunit [Sulfurovum mangrovi]|uniref:efflux RND transporter periplasmic adaptor subunit n=1 Tax=Sulfurovum mangrovi TaxID=2893889 RepID=UPI001E4E7085|nr:efflux RND transporter periplasmic adaptor subunit [Sulfurovum mangrovi]UFH60205.1 efflux RND transporter periplasmic adaptor subunit [Sulfurovum mangrovi]
MKKIEEIVAYKGTSKKKIAVYIGVFLFLFILGFSLFSGKDQTRNHYLTEPLKKGDLTIIVSASGYIEPLESVDVGSEVSGTIKEVYVENNDIVTEGQHLAQLDKTKYESIVNQNRALLDAAKATLESAEAKLEKTKSIVDRNKELRESTKGSLPSKNDWEEDWSNYLSAKADVANAKAQVEQSSHALTSAKYDLEKTLITSPINGIVLVREIDPGQTVAASYQTPVLFTIAKNLTQMELRVDVDEADIGHVKEGQSATFSVDTYSEKIFNATIKKVRVNSEETDGVVTYETIMDVNNSQLLLRPGMSADADIVTKSIKNVFIISRSGLLFNPVEKKDTKAFQFRNEEKSTIDQKPHVWILKDNTPQKIYVKVLEREGSKSAIASDELKENDLIILAQEKQDDNS